MNAEKTIPVANKKTSFQEEVKPIIFYSGKKRNPISRLLSLNSLGMGGKGSAFLSQLKSTDFL